MKFKSIYILLLCLCTGLGKSYGQRTVHKFIDKVKAHDDAIAMTIPGWLVRTGVRIANDEKDIDETRGYRDIIKGIRKVRFAAVDGSNPVPADQVKRLVRLAQEKEGMEEYIRVKDDGQHVIVLMKEKNDKVSNVTIITSSEDEFVIVTVKTKISLTELQNADFSWNSEQNAN